jgi:imidazolonepropionase-like amidohydrolase
MKHTTVIVAIPLCLLMPPAAMAEVIAITGGKVVVGNGTVYDNATVVIDGGVISAVGEQVPIPDGARTVEAAGMVVWPGMIDPYTTLGLIEVSMDEPTNDANEATDSSTAELRASDGIDPYAEPIAVTRIGGITTALVSPGTSNPINGQAAIISLAGRTTADMLVADDAALVFNFGAQRDDEYPSTRPGTVAFIRQSLYDAQAYKESRQRAKDGCENGQSWECDSKRDLGNEAVLRALAREVPVIAITPRSQDIANALALAEEFDLRMILYDTREVWKMLDQVATSGVPVLLQNTFDMPSDRDPYDRYYTLAHSLRQAGIPFAFTTGGNHDVRNLPEHAAMAVTFGLAEEDAVKALTSNAASILGIDASLGTLEAGKSADVVIWNGNPLQITSRVERLFIRGREIPLRSRQEMLRDKYQQLDAAP